MVYQKRLNSRQENLRLLMTFTGYLKESQYSFFNHKNKPDQRKATLSANTQRLHEPSNMFHEEQEAQKPSFPENLETFESSVPKEKDISLHQRD
jgi:hypothetical protein